MFFVHKLRKLSEYGKNSKNTMFQIFVEGFLQHSYKKIESLSVIIKPFMKGQSILEKLWNGKTILGL